MIKTINHQNFLTTPFVAYKAWHLFNDDSDDLVLTETTGSEDTIALEFVDYSTGTPFVNTTCSIALEEQDDDRLEYQEGITGSGTFFPETEPINEDGTFKRLVHSQIQATFYNTYHNPLEIFGIENIDFPLGGTFRDLSDFTRVFTIPRDIFGEKILPNSVQMMDNSLDDNVSIFDDGNQNIMAGFNLFSKIQEVRHFGNFISMESSSVLCGGTPPIFSPVLDAEQVGFNQDIFVTWTYEGADQTDWLLERSFDSGSTWPSQIPIADPMATSYDDTDCVFGETIWYRISAHNAIGYGPLSNTASVFVMENPNPCDLDPTILSGSYGIQGYVDGQIPNPTFGSPQGVVWNGEFTKFTYDAENNNGSFYNGEIGDNFINGHSICINTLEWRGCTDNTGSWMMTINDGGCGNVLWRGTKTGLTPDGVYTYNNDDVGNDGPPTFTVEFLGNPTAPLDGSSTCCS